MFVAFPFRPHAGRTPFGRDCSRYRSCSRFTNLRIDPMLDSPASPSSSLRGPWPSSLTGLVCFVVFLRLPSSLEPFGPFFRSSIWSLRKKGVGLRVCRFSIVVVPLPLINVALGFAFGIFGNVNAGDARNQQAPTIKNCRNS